MFALVIVIVLVGYVLVQERKDLQLLADGCMTLVVDSNAFCDEQDECANYSVWLTEVKELGGYYLQPEEGDQFYIDCWRSGKTAQQVTDYLNN